LKFNVFTDAALSKGQHPNLSLIRQWLLVHDVGIIFWFSRCCDWESVYCFTGIM